MFRTATYVLGLLLIAMPLSADWPGFRGADGTGRVEGGLPEGEGFLDFEIAWKHPLGSGYSGIAIAGDRLVTAATEGETDFVVALALEDGRELWRHDLPAPYKGHDGSHDGPIATPAIADGRVFMVGAHGTGIALDLESGELLWSKHFVEEMEKSPPFYGFGSSPLVVGDLVIVQIGGDSGSVVGLDAASGDVRWQSFDEAGQLGQPSPVATELGGKLQVVVAASAKLAGLDPMDGSVLWEMPLEGGIMGTRTQAPMPIGDDRLFVKHQDGETFVVTVAKGDEGWSAEASVKGKGLSRSYSPPTTGAQALYGYTARFLSAVDPATGELLWRSREPGDGFLVNVGGQLAVLAKAGSLHLGAASTDGWQESSRVPLFDDLAWTPPSHAGEAIYARSLTEIARVDLVRRDRKRSADAPAAMPEILTRLAAEVAAAEDRSSVVEAFLADRDLPLADGDEVVFLYRGEADDVAVAGEMIGARTEEPMQRLEGTDLWWWSTELDPKARVSYLYFVDYQPRVDPAHERHGLSTLLGPDMNFNFGPPMSVSWYAGPEWPGRADTGAGEGGGTVEQIEISLQPPTPEGDGAETEGEVEAPEPIAVQARVWLPPGYEDGDERYPVVYVHQPGAFESMAWPAALEASVGSRVRPLIAVELQLPRMPGVGALFASQFVPEFDQRFRTIAGREGRANVGMGFSSGPAVMTTLQHPDLFSAFGVQSLLMLDTQMAHLDGLLEEFDAESTPVRGYLEWGRWDLHSPYESWDVRTGSLDGWERLAAAGIALVGGEVWDGTDVGSWGNRVEVLLAELFGLEGAASGLDRWQTAP